MSTDRWWVTVDESDPCPACGCVESFESFDIRICNECHHWRATPGWFTEDPFKEEHEDARDRRTHC